MKRLISMICVFLVMASLLTVICLATDPYVDYKMVVEGNIYAGSGGTGATTYILRGKRLTGGSSSNTGWTYSNSSYSIVLYGSTTKYARNNMVLPLYKSYVINKNNIYITDAQGHMTSLPKYTTYIHKISTSGGNDYVRAYLTSGILLGNIPSNSIAIDYGY